MFFNLAANNDSRMKSINLSKIIEDCKLDEEVLASELFPFHKHPQLALERVKKGKGLLNSEQIAKLSQLSNLPIDALFGVDGWKYVNNKGRYIFTCDTFKAELDTTTWVTKVYDADSLFHEEIIHDGTVALSEYIGKLNIIINKYRSNEQN